MGLKRVVQSSCSRGLLVKHTSLSQLSRLNWVLRDARERLETTQAAWGQLIGESRGGEQISMADARGTDAGRLCRRRRGGRSRDAQTGRRADCVTGEMGGVTCE